MNGRFGRKLLNEDETERKDIEYSCDRSSGCTGETAPDDKDPAGADEGNG